MKPDALVVPSASGPNFQPLLPFLDFIPLEDRKAWCQRLEGLDRAKLLTAYDRAFTSGQRAAFFMLSDELTTRGIPPIFRYSCLLAEECSVNQQFDLLMADMRWLRCWYPDHFQSIRYKRYQLLFGRDEKMFHRAAEYVFFQGQRPLWKITASMSLSQRQQSDCIILAAAPIKRQRKATQARQEAVFKALQNDLQNVRRTKSFTDEEAQAALIRRHALWLCWRMTEGSPSETARRYQQMTGQEITRQAAAKQLEKIHRILR